MSRITCVLILLSIPLLPAARADDDMKKELKALEGKWNTVGLEAGGKPFPKDGIPKFVFIVGADGKASGKSAQGDFESTVTVDPKKSPRTIDNAHDTGTHKGKTQYGIYKLEGDKWIVCMTSPGAKESDRPTSFDTKDTANVVFIFERVKDDKK